MRTEEEILVNPQHEDLVSGRTLGYMHPCKYVWLPCSACGTYRWVQNTKEARKRKGCRNCLFNWASRRGERIASQPRPHMRRYSPDAEGKFKTLRAGDTPKEGDIIRGDEIGRDSQHLFRWALCPDCKIGRWIIQRTPGNPRCAPCGNEYKKGTYIGEKSSQWKGGRIGRPHGYFDVRVQPTSPYFPMANCLGYVPEHRLVMAKHLGRCLSRSELVHHCHTKYPSGSDADRGDNRINNLRLVAHKDEHDAITSLERQVRILQKEVADLRRKNKMEILTMRDTLSVREV